MTIRVTAPAKLNLYLHITGKRADGYHLLESLVAFTQFGDVLECSAADVLTLSVVDEFAPLLSDVEDNLVLKTARLLQAHAGISTGAHIVLHKHIPVGAGLGGGSADAAAALAMLVTFWGVEISDTALQRIALTLGSDVPMCLVSQAAMVRGVGEEITPVAMNVHAGIVLAHPRTPLLTAEVYRHFSGEFASTTEIPAHIDSLEALLAIIAPRYNGLEAAAIACMPVIGEILTALRPGCLLARMSGSGAGCFGIYGDEATAQVAARQLQAAHPQWWFIATHLRSTHG